MPDATKRGDFLDYDEVHKDDLERREEKVSRVFGVARKCSPCSVNPVCLLMIGRRPCR